MRRALGVAVFSGMLGVTLFGIFLAPVFYYLMEKDCRRNWRPVYRGKGTNHRRKSGTVNTAGKSPHTRRVKSNS